MKRTGAYLVGQVYEGQYDVDAILASLHMAIVKSEMDFDYRLGLGLIFSFARDLPHAVNLILAEKIAKHRKKLNTIVGVDLAGPESKRTYENADDLARLKECYDIAAGDCLGRTVHLGETEHTTVEIFIKVIEALNVTRVAHPISIFRAYQRNGDDRGLKLLQERRIVCEICSYSNRLTRAISTPEDFRELFETLDKFDIPFAFGPDSPALQSSTLAWEIEWLLANHALTADQLERSFATADRATFIRH